MKSLQQKIEELHSSEAIERTPETLALIDALLTALERGEARSASRDGAGGWTVHSWVKRGILLGFRLGRVRQFAVSPLPFFDKDTYPPQEPAGIARNIRIVPGGSSIRRGAFIGEGVVCMPPMYVNVGAYVGNGSMIDSHALVGSCAQVGENVHVSAAAQIGGVLEPIGAMPVIIEDEVLLGGNTGVYEGTLVRRRAVIAAGVVLTGSTPVYDLVREKVYRREAGRPLEIPAGAVVLPGARPLRGSFADEHGLSVSAPVIVKYRDEKTDASTALEAALR